MNKKTSKKNYFHIRDGRYSHGWRHLAHLNNDLNQPLANEFYQTRRKHIEQLVGFPLAIFEKYRQKLPIDASQQEIDELTEKLRDYYKERL